MFIILLYFFVGKLDVVAYDCLPVDVPYEGGVWSHELLDGPNCKQSVMENPMDISNG